LQERLHISRVINSEQAISAIVQTAEGMKRCPCQDRDRNTCSGADRRKNEELSEEEEEEEEERRQAAVEVVGEMQLTAEQLKASASHHT